LDRVIAWNHVVARVYHLGPNVGYGPDLDDELPSGERRVYPQFAQKMTAALIMFDRTGPFRPAGEAVRHQEWRQVALQQLGQTLSYWEPLRVFGEPPWMQETLAEFQQYPEFSEIWRAAQLERAALKLGPDQGTTRGALYDTLDFHIGELHIL